MRIALAFAFTFAVVASLPSRAQVGEGEGEGEGAAGEGEGSAEATACTPTPGAFNSTGTCGAGLVCVPDGGSGPSGHCRVPCALDATHEDPSVTCPAGEACLTQTALPALNITSIACQPPAGHRDDVCQAVGDTDACPAGTDCDVAQKQGQSALALRCKEACTKDDQCQNNEICALAAIQSANIEKDQSGNTVHCDGNEVACANGAASCPCSLGDGFVCQVFNINGGGTGSFCNLPERLCGVVIAAAPPGTDLNNIPEASRCNVVDEDRYCDQSMYAGATGVAGNDQCIGPKLSSHDGACFPLCSTPDFDANGDGAISDSERGQQLACGVGFHCSTDLGASIGVAQTATNPAPACDPSTCPAGQPCPACGAGAMQCIKPAGTNSPICAAPFGGCVADGGEGEGEGEGAKPPPPTAKGCTCSSTSASSSALFGLAATTVGCVVFSRKRARRSR